MYTLGYETNTAVCTYTLLLYTINHISCTILLYIDPLGLGQKLCGDDSNKKLIVQTIEIFNGRMSMLAVTGYAAQEYFTS